MKSREGLQALLKLSPKTHEAYIKAIPNDPWGRPYNYKNTQGNYEIICYGADGQAGGNGANADIIIKGFE